MGGRGDSFSVPQRGKWGNGPGDPVAGSLKGAIGAKGAPKSLGDAVVETNPHHSYSYREFSENCQRCVVAYEMRRRGYDVEALPTYQGDRLGAISFVKDGIYHAQWRGAFQHAKTESVAAEGNNAAAEKQVMKNISDKMHQYGDGSRAVIQILYRGGGGHVFNVENHGGRIVYVEAQTGKVKDMAFTMKSVKTESVNIVRVDNLRPSDRMRNFVKRKNR